MSHALADQCALCDAWHASVVGAIWPNRLFAHGGTSEDVLRDAERGTLPAVAWVDPGFTWNDDHPPHHPGSGRSSSPR